MLRRAFALLTCLAALGAGGVGVSAGAAQTNAPQAPPGRYLLIVDTSAAMDRSAANMRQIVGKLVASGFNGQMRPGDTLGLWTFDEELHAGGFPLQRWSPQTSQRVAAAVVEHLQRHPYGKKSRFEKVGEPLTRVVRDSEKITLLVVSAGEGQIQGTPYDRDVNEAFKLNYASQRKQRLPFVAVLRASRGEFLGFTVNTPPWPVEFPPFPVEPVPSPRQAAKAEPEARPPSSTPPTEPAGAAPPPKPPSAKSPTNTATSAQVTAATKQPEPNLPVAARPEPKPTEAGTPSAPHPPATDIPAAATENSAPAPPAAAPAAVPATIPKPTEAKVAPQADSNSDSQKPIATSPAVTVSQSKTLSAPQSAVANVSSPATQPSLPETAAKLSDAAPATEIPSVSTPPVMQAAAPTPQRSWFNRRIILIGGGALLMIALGLLILVLRRPRPPERISLITRSMDRDGR